MSDRTDAVERRLPRMWVLHCPFRKDGVPVLGSFGKTIKPVVILPLEVWERLCFDIPALGTMNFDVGSETNDD